MLYTILPLRLRMSFCVWKHCWYTILPFSDCHSRAQHVLNIGIMGLLLEKSVSSADLQLRSCSCSRCFSYLSISLHVLLSLILLIWCPCRLIIVFDACFVEILCFSWIVILHGERLLKWSEISGVNSLKSWDAFVCSIPEAKFAKMIQELQCVWISL